MRSVQSMRLCEGVCVTKSIQVSRFHTLEKWKSSEKEERKVRSVICKKLIPLNALINTCRICQKMTFGQKTANVALVNTTENAKLHPNKIEKATMPLQPSKDSIKKLIPGATDEMVELIFSQAQNVSRDPRGRRWSREMIVTCLQWYCRSPQSYEAFRETGYLVLPSRSVLISYKNKIKQDVGFDNNIFHWMLEEAKRKKIPEEGYMGGIILDEMSIQSDIQISKNGDVVELAGLVDVGDEGNITQVMRSGKQQKQLGTHALQLVFLGITGFRFPIAHFITDGVQAPQLYPLFWEAVDKLKVFSFRVLYTCMDGAQSNRTFMKMNIGENSTTFTSNSPCLFTPMVFMMDPSHVIKKIRNNIIKSGISDKSTRTLTLPSNDTILWQMFVDAFNWDRTNALQLHRKLTNEHIYPSNQEKMRNHLAEDVLCTEMLHLFLQFQKYMGDRGCVLNGVIQLLKVSSKLISIFRDMRPIRTIQDTRLEDLMAIAHWFKSWTTQAKNKKCIMSVQCHEDIQSCIIGFIQLCKAILVKNGAPSNVYVTPGLVNSDVIENTFNQQRSTFHGANANPNALQYRRALNSIILCQNIVSTKANAGKNRVSALPYDCIKPTNPRKKRKAKPEHNTETKIKVVRL